MTTLHRVALALDHDTDTDLRLRGFRQAETIGGMRAGMTVWADCDLPRWGTVRLTEHPSGRIELHSTTASNGERVVQIADLNRDVPALAVAWMLVALGQAEVDPSVG